MRFQEGTFNTIGQRQAQFGGNFPVWARVRELYKGGGKIDASQFAPGTVIGAGTMVKFNGSGQEVEIITANGVEGVKEVDKVTVTSGCTTNGNVGIKLNNASVVNIAVTTAENTPESVAAKIAAGSFSGLDSQTGRCKRDFHQVGFRTMRCPSRGSQFHRRESHGRSRNGRCGSQRFIG